MDHTGPANILHALAIPENSENAVSARMQKYQAGAVILGSRQQEARRQSFRLAGMVRNLANKIAESVSWRDCPAGALVSVLRTTSGCPDARNVAPTKLRVHKLRCRWQHGLWKLRCRTAHRGVHKLRCRWQHGLWKLRCRTAHRRLPLSPTGLHRLKCGQQRQSADGCSL